MRPRTKRMLIWFTSFTLLALVGLVAVVSRFVFDSPFDEASFDRATWLAMAGDMDPDNPRGPMAAALIEKLQGEELSRDAVLQLLGPADYPCSALSPSAGPIDTCFSYNLGMWSGLRLDYDTLDIYFKEDNRVARVLTVQH